MCLEGMRKGLRALWFMGSATRHQGLSGWNSGDTHAHTDFTGQIKGEAGKHGKEEISTNEDCTDYPKLQLLPSLAASQQFLQSPQMQFFTLVLCFPSPSPGLRIQCASVELHPQLQVPFRHSYHPSTAQRPRQAPPAPTKGRRATGVQWTSPQQRVRMEE